MNPGRWTLVVFRGLLMLAWTLALADPRNDDIAAAVRHGEELAHALDPHVNYPLPEGMGSLEDPPLPPAAPPIGSYFKGRVQDVWGTPWHVETDPRRLRDVSFESDGVRYTYRGSERFWLRSAGRDRKLRTPDDIVVDAAGRLWRISAGLRLAEVLLDAELDGVVARQESMVADAAKLYADDRGGCPQVFPGSIEELIEEGYLDRQLAVDAWGNPWEFCVQPAAPPEHRDVQNSVDSAGADGAWKTGDDVLGGEGFGACVLPPPPPGAGCEPLTRAELLRLPQPELASNIRRRFACDEAETRMLAYEAASVVADPSFLEPAIHRYPDETPLNRARIVQLLGALKDVRGLPIVLSGLGDTPNAPDALRAIGSASNLAEAIDAYLGPWSWTPERRLRTLSVLAEWAPTEDIVLRLIEEAFDQAAEKSRPKLASLALKAQLEPGKPLPPGSAPISTREDCITTSEWRRALAPYSRREVERMLRPANRKFLQAAGFGLRQEAWTSFHNLAMSLDPEEQVKLWRRVIAAFGDDASGRGDPRAWSCAPYAARQATALALVSLASARLPENCSESERHLLEGDAIAEGLVGSTAIQTVDPGIRAAIELVRTRLLRLRGSAGGKPPLLPRHFTRSGIVGRGARDLFLDGSGAYRMVIPTDFVSIPCDPAGENISEGRYSVERGYLLLSPGEPTGGAAIPESFRIVEWVGAFYLVDDEERFCRTAKAVGERVADCLGRDAGDGTKADACRQLLLHMDVLVAAGESPCARGPCPPPVPEICSGS